MQSILTSLDFVWKRLFFFFFDCKCFSTAAIGFQYCLETLRPKLAKENADYADALALWLMLLNGYAYFLYYVGRPDEAFKYFKEARSVREQIGGEQDEQLVLLLNNLGTVSKLRGDTDAALRYFHEAEKLGKNFADMENFSFVYLNLAYLYMEFKMADRAREYCDRAMRNASRHEFKEGIKESQECLSKVEEALKGWTAPSWPSAPRWSSGRPQRLWLEEMLTSTPWLIVFLFAVWRTSFAEYCSRKIWCHRLSVRFFLKHVKMTTFHPCLFCRITFSPICSPLTIEK